MAVSTLGIDIEELEKEIEWGIGIMLGAIVDLAKGAFDEVK